MMAACNDDELMLLRRQLLALDEEAYRPQRNEDGTWSVCDDEMGVLVCDLQSAQDVAEWIIADRGY